MDENFYIVQTVFSTFFLKEKRIIHQKMNIEYLYSMYTSKKCTIFYFLFLFLPLYSLPIPADSVLLSIFINTPLSSGLAFFLGLLFLFDNYFLFISCGLCFYNVFVEFCFFLNFILFNPF